MGFTVVVVDDDAGFRKMAGRLLTLRGFDVVADAADGDQALEVIRTHHPDGVLLDVHLPGRDGPEVARDICGEPSAPRVVLTSTAQFGYLDSELASWGVTAFVAKDELARTDLMDLFTRCVN
jgi:CheY-like chemotaxis protein